MDMLGSACTQSVVEVSEWFDWLRKELPLGGLQLPDEESATLLIYNTLHTVRKAQSIYRHLPDSLVDKIVGAAVVYGCWKIQHDLRERARIPRRQATLPACLAASYVGPLGESGSHHLVEGENCFKYAVTIPSGLWTETLPATEIISNELARLLGLTVPQASLVTLSPEILRQAGLTRPPWSQARHILAPKHCCGFRYVEPGE